MTMQKPGKTRLETWKEIGAFLGKTERTAKRWERERGLPVHRLPGAGRSRIYAEVAELEVWFKSAGAFEEDDAALVVHQSSPRLPSFAAWGAVLVLLGLLAASVFVLPGIMRPVHKVPAPAQAMFVKGMEDWNSRTPQSLERAVDDFNQAIRIDPDDAEAYAGLANCYNLLREYTGMPSSQAYPLARAAAEHALKLDDHLADAHTALAFTLYYGYWDAVSATREYEKSLVIEPNNAISQHWYATFLMARNDVPEALDHINRAMALDPSSEAIKADRALILYFNGNKTDALATLKALAQADPAFRSPHAHLAYIYSIEGDDPAFVREALASAKSGKTNDELDVARSAARALQAGGHIGMLNAMLQTRLGQFHDGTGSAYAVAVLYSQLGDAREAMTWLSMAVDRREADVADAPVDRRMAFIMKSGSYQKQLDRLVPL